jgi:type II secretory pathway pseudopilin PulG
MRVRATLGTLRGRGGFSIAELLLAMSIFIFVIAALTSLYVSTKDAFDLGSSQAYLQRQGTLIQERVSRLAQNAVAMQVMDCGPNGSTAGTSIVILDANGTVWCIYQSVVAADTNADLRLCKVASFTSPIGACNGGLLDPTGSDQSMLDLMQSEVAQRLGAVLRVRNLTFTAVTCVQPGGPCAPTDVGRMARTPLVDVRFDLTDGRGYNPNYHGGAFSATNFLGMRFGFGATTRN